MAAVVVNGLSNGEMDTQQNAPEKPALELFLKASAIDSRRIGACLFCQEFWMELYALYELGLVRVEVKTVNVNSEPFKRNFLGAQPPILVETTKSVTYTDNREIEGRIFHIAKEFMVPLFEKDVAVEKKIETLYRNFKVYMRSKMDSDKLMQRNGQAHIEGDIAKDVQAPHNKLYEQLHGIDNLLRERGSRYLLGDSMTEYDCELMPRLHHIRIVGKELCSFEIDANMKHLWNYMLTAYRTAAFVESCPADQDIIHHYKDQLNMTFKQRETLQSPTKTHTIPDGVLSDIRRMKLDV
jgi:chloride intracellular channel protein 2